MAKSKKPPVVERIFDTLLDPTTGQLTRRVVTHQDIVDAINWAGTNLGIKLSTNNPANFMKDIVRGKGASKMWPERLKELRITGRQLTGGGRALEFIDYEPDQSEPFPDRLKFDVSKVARHEIQSISLSLANKELGRDDETYLIQVAAKLSIIETHLALFSTLDVREVSHLQVGIKLRKTEIDSLYGGRYVDELGTERPFIITAEAKKRGQVILEDQVIRQVIAAFKLTKVDLVVPIAMAIVDVSANESGIDIVEFASVRREDVKQLEVLTVASRRVYVLKPPIKGI